MRKTTYVMGVPFDVIKMDEASDKVMKFFEDGGSHIVCTPNPEIVMAAQEDEKLMSILKAADMVVPDGIGVVLASKFNKVKIEERVAGYDLCHAVFEKMAPQGKTVYFFGGAPGVAHKAADKMTKKYKGLKIVGTRNGYFTAADEKEIIREIKKHSPDLLLVGLGSPKQEKWIYENLRFTGAKAAIGVGGSFDVMAGNVKRAPKAFQKLGLEWFYRLLCQPTRIKRMMKLPVFAVKVIFSKKG
ncbi:MAG: WecB/TagA/CpsF family glycosyltransferase [Firmicutes bacterium]|nr:WecB/TagA/CpsF family glycosyltransferase [Bacillota bacterium]